MKKYVYRYCIIVVILVCLIISVISYNYDILNSTKFSTENNIFSANGDNLIPRYDEISITQIDDLNMPYPLNKMYKVGNEKAYLYSLSYADNTLDIGDTLKLDEDMLASDQLYMLFRESYPNISLEEMGLETEEEAYQAVQLAIYEMASRTGEAMYGSELSRIDSIRGDLGEKNINARVFEKARQLVDTVINYDFVNNEEINLIPTLIINTESVRNEVINYDSSYLIGPYKYRVETGIITAANITISEEGKEETSAVLVDKEGKEVKDFTATKEVYIKIPRDYVGKMYITFEVKVKRLEPAVYKVNNRDFLVNSYVENEISNFVTANIQKGG